MGALEDEAAAPGRDEEEAATEEVVGRQPEPDRRRVIHQLIAGGIFLAILAIVLPLLFSWQSENQQKALSLSNMRRVSTGCLLYMQDWDERLPPPVQRAQEGFVVTWPRLVRPYVLLDDAFSNPSNPVKPFADRPLLHDPTTGLPVNTSYALNRRFWGEYGPGPFPFGNLEIPEQTALIVEAGRMAADPRHPHFSAPTDSGPAVDLYGDTTDRILGMSPYPSVHGGQIGIIAADGHGVMTRALYYRPSDGPHDTLLGRVGDAIYDWNGGHPNGETDRPARE